MPAFKAADGTTLHYEVAGDGPPVLFLHGYTATIRMWDALIPDLAPSFMVIRLDQRGHGASDDGPADGFSFARMADDAVALLDTLGLGHAAVVGHSMGGMVVFELMARHAGRLNAAVLSSTTPNAPPQAYFENTIAFALSLGDIPTAKRAADPMMQSSDPMSETAARSCGAMILGLNPDMSALAAFSAPTLVIHGDADSAGIIGGSDTLAQTIPNASRVIIEGAGHVPQITHTATYSAALLGFLEESMTKA